MKSNNKLNGIISALSQEDCILFIGSGISLWSGMPSWNSLILELAEFIEKQGESKDLILKELEKGDLLQAASYGLDKLTKSQIGDFFKQVCRYGDATPSDIHRQLITLGPKSYITTNYDTLLEDSINKWATNKKIDIVTNRQLTEMANIVHSSAKDFIYKFHGDVRDVESIILTREQYRVLLPQGERHNAMETLKTLLISRPVVYIGFGLRDPDFLYLKDILFNTYQGNNRDHYAIMPDIDLEEATFWKKKYGIHLISYATKNGNHSQLSTLLSEIKKSIDKKDEINTGQNESFFSMMRYASTLAYEEKQESKFIINVSNSLSESKKLSLVQNPFRFYKGNIEDFLKNFENQILLIGSAGAGKTFSLKQAQSMLGNQMLKILSSQNENFASLTIPIYLYLKMYAGSLDALLEDTLPQLGNFEEQGKKIQLKIFIDSFNETPKKFRESPELIEDIQNFLNAHSETPIVIASRSITGLESLNLDAYHLDEIANKTIDKQLQKRNITLPESWEKETYILLKKPLFFQYFISNRVDIQNITQPKDFYEQIFLRLQKEFDLKFSIEFDLTKLLSSLAYEVLDKGNEAFHQELFFNNFKKHEGLLSGFDLINWLISQDILVSHTLSRISFVHQSITEYLAALKLSDEYENDSQILKSKLGLYRWDQAVYLTINLLPENHVTTFITTLFELDFTFALGSLKYAEVNQEKITKEALLAISKTKNFSMFEHRFVLDFPITDSHEFALRKIIDNGGVTGGIALEKLVELKGGEIIKTEIESLLFSHSNDFNFGMYLGRVLSNFIDENDIIQLVSIIKKIEYEKESDEETSGLVNAISTMTKNLSLDNFKKYFISYPLSDISETMMKIISEKLRSTRTQDSLNMLAELLLANKNGITFEIYSVSNWSETHLSYDCFSEKHIDIMLNLLNDFDDDWVLHALGQVCNARDDLKHYALYQIQSWPLELRAPFESLIMNKEEIIFEYFNYLIKLEPSKIENLSFQRISELDINWATHENLFLQLMELDNIELNYSILSHVFPPTIKGLGLLPIKSIDKYLNLLANLINSNHEYSSWVSRQLSYLLANHVGEETKQKFVDEFNNPSSPYTEILLNLIIPNLEYDIHLYNEHSIQYALEDLKKKYYSPQTIMLEKVFLVESSTEKFIDQRLLPLLSECEKGSFFESNLKTIIYQVGKRYGKRYFF